MALLAAEAVLCVLLGPFGVGRAATLEGIGAGALAGFVELVVDGDVEEVGLVGGEIIAIFGSL